MPLKPCEGRLSEEVQQVLQKNRDRAQWAAHPCEICGLEVEAIQVKGVWTPKPHWPTVKYKPRKGAVELKTAVGVGK